MPLSEFFQLSTFLKYFLLLYTLGEATKPIFYILWINILLFHLPFDHHLCYNNLAIRDIPLCISKCRIHLLPLLFVCENFPVALKMYFLLSVSALLYMDSMPDKAASEYFFFFGHGVISCAKKFLTLILTHRKISCIEFEYFIAKNIYSSKLISVQVLSTNLQLYKLFILRKTLH